MTQGLVVLPQTLWHAPIVSLGKIQLFLPQRELILTLGLSDPEVMRDSALFSFDASDCTSLDTELGNFEIAFHAHHNRLQVEERILFESFVNFYLVIAVTLQHFGHSLLKLLQLKLLLRLLLHFQMQILFLFIGIAHACECCLGDGAARLLQNFLILQGIFAVGLCFFAGTKLLQPLHEALAT